MEQISNAANVPYPAVYRSMMTVGLLGSVYGRRDEADVVGEAIEMTLADPLPYRVNRAIAEGIGGDAKFASEKLGEHLDKHPDDDSTKVIVAVSKMLAGDPEWKAMLDSVLASSSDQTARQAARDVMDYLRSLA